MNTETMSPAPQELENGMTQDPNANGTVQNEVPEKYRGKSVQEIIDMHANAERELGRARNEVGTVRKLADELLGLTRAQYEAQVRQANSTPREKITSEALFQDPEKAITEVVRREAEESAQLLNERLSRQEKALALNAFEKRHSGYKDLMESPDFLGWVQQSPHRLRLAAAAAQNDDFIAADELFGLYEEVQAVRGGQTQNDPKTGPAAAARQASLAKSGGSSAAGVMSTNAGKKIWSRAELIDMRIKDPAKFDSLYESEILPAYREKRVK